MQSGLVSPVDTAACTGQAVSITSSNNPNADTDVPSKDSRAAASTQDTANLLASELWDLLAVYMQLGVADACMDSSGELRTTLTRCRVIASFFEASAFAVATRVPRGWPSEPAHDRIRAAGAVASTQAAPGTNKGPSKGPHTSSTDIRTWGMHAAQEFRKGVRQAAVHACALAMARGAHVL